MRSTDKNRNQNKSIQNSQLNKSVIVRTKTPNKQIKNSTIQQSQVLKKSIISKETSKPNDFIGYIDIVTDNLNHKKQKMQACIDLFNLMHSNNMQLRCMQHNNILTLYCLTERRILCVNCTYGVTKHRTHRVLPLRDSINYVADDNTLLRDIIDSDLKVLEDSLKNSQQNSYLLEKQMKKLLEKVQLNYQNKVDQIRVKYQTDKKKIRDGFQSTIYKTRTLQKNIEQFKFKIWQTLSKIGIGKRNESATNETEIIRQVFCVNLSQLTKLQIRRITKKQLERLLTSLQE